MPTTVIAGQSGQAPQGMVITGWDWAPVAGVPMWLFVAAALGVVFLVVCMYWIFRIRKLSAVKGFVQAAGSSNHDNICAWLISNTRKLAIVNLIKRDNVLGYPEGYGILQEWLHTNPGAVLHIGGVPGVLLGDEFMMSRDMIGEIALVQCCEQYNRDQDKLGGIPIKGYEDYMKFGRNRIEATNPDGIRIPSYSIYNPSKFLKYGPPDMSAALSGGIFERDAKKLNSDQPKKSFWERATPLLVTGLVCGAIIMAAWFAPLGK
jgi:hypothetical protein